MRVEMGFFDYETDMDGNGNTKSAKVPYFVFGVEDEKAALDAVLAEAASSLYGMGRSGVSIDERISPDVFKVIVEYENDSISSSSGNSGGTSNDTEENESSFSFDTGGGTKHVTQSILTVTKVPTTAPDFGGAIGVDNDGNVNGVDITMPVMHFSETHFFKASCVTTTFKKRLAGLTGTINKSAFRGFQAGEVLFLGAAGTRRGTDSEDEWEITYRFAVSPNRKNIKLGPLSVSQKYGWDYLWVRYIDVLSPNQQYIIKQPEAAYVERVYYLTDFGELGIGK